MTSANFYLWSPYGIGRTIIFSSCHLFFFFSLTKSQQPQIGCLPYFHIWCGPSADLESRSETCCTRLAENTVRKKSAKNSPSAHQKNLLSSNISSTFPHNMLDFGTLAPEICSGVWGTQANFNGFRVTARHSSSGCQPNCGVEQRAPPIFCTATITLPTFLVVIITQLTHFTVPRRVEGRVELGTAGSH